MDNFQISKRTALRDIASLEELGLAYTPKQAGLAAIH